MCVFQSSFPFSRFCRPISLSHAPRSRFVFDSQPGPKARRCFVVRGGGRALAGETLRTLANLSPPPLLLFLCQGQPPTNVGVECSVYLRGRESGMGHFWRAAAKLSRTSRRKLTVCPCQFFSSLPSHVRIAICCFHWVVLFCLPPPGPLFPLSVALVLKTQSLIVHSFSSTNFYMCSSRNTTLLVFPWR